MRKIIPLAMILFFAVSCGPSDEKAAIKETITKYKDEVSELTIKIRELEEQLEHMEDDGNRYNVPVTIDELMPGPFRHYFQVSGTVDAIDKAFISPEINGQVTEIMAEEGEQVKQGQLLAKLNTSITENTMQEVETQLELARTLFNKQQQLWEKRIGSEVQYLQAKNNVESLERKMQTLRAQLDMAYIKSPIDGIVDGIFVEEGELAMPGLQLMQVVNLEKLKVFADVSENYLPVLNPGDSVTLTFPTFPGIKLEKEIDRIGNVINIGNRTFPVELRLENIDGKLKPNILALITFLDYSVEDALVVPSIIIKEDIQGKYIYVARKIDGKTIAKKVYITTGMSYNDETMVVSGLNPGDSVIIEGYSLVTDGTEVNII